MMFYARLFAHLHIMPLMSDSLALTDVPDCSVIYSFIIILCSGNEKVSSSGPRRFYPSFNGFTGVSKISNAIL